MGSPYEMTSTPIKATPSGAWNDPEKRSISRPVGDNCIVEVEFNSPKMCVTVSTDGGSSSGSDEQSSTNESMVALLNSINNIHVRIKAVYVDNTSIVYKTGILQIIEVVYGILLVLYLAYLGYAIFLDHHRALPLIVITGLLFLMAGYNLLKHYIGASVCECFSTVYTRAQSKALYIQWILALLLLGGIITMITLVSIQRTYNLISVAGFFAFISFLYLFSYRRSKVRWRPVIGGFLLQFTLALVILRWRYGYHAFVFLGRKIADFLSYTNYGSEFLFGSNFRDHLFAFQVLPVIIFFSCVVSTLYYMGVMQVVIGKIAWIMQITLGTTAAESLNTAGNIFVGQTEAPILIRPFLEVMTRSELHAVMTGGFATIAGAVMAAYIQFGVPAEHLLCASVMNAPSALAVSKLFYPETEVSELKSSKNIPMPKRTESNLIEAAAAGASASIMLVANVAANLIAFLALLAFVNGMLSWFGGLVDYPELSFQLICSYIFRPIAFLMGVDWEDAPLVGELIGTKTFLNEFVAYEKLSVFIRNRVECRDGPTISVRSEIITTYALCGFANMSSIGIQLGGIGPMAPSRRADLAKIAVRALTAGTIACFVTASIAGMLVDDDRPLPACMLNTTLPLNTSSPIVNSTTLLLSRYL